MKRRWNIKYAAFAGACFGAIGAILGDFQLWGYVQIRQATSLTIIWAIIFSVVVLIRNRVTRFDQG
jgi:polyferredoxin